METERWKDFHGLVISRARSFHNTTNIPLEDLIQEAWVAVIEAIEIYNPERGALSTIVYIRITTHLIDFCKQWKRIVNVPDYYKEQEYMCKQMKSFLFTESLKELKQDRKFVIDLINEKIDINQNARSMRKQTRNELKKQGWKERKIKKAFDGIKQFFRT